MRTYYRFIFLTATVATFLITHEAYSDPQACKDIDREAHFLSTYLEGFVSYFSKYTTYKDKDHGPKQELQHWNTWIVKNGEIDTLFGLKKSLVNLKAEADKKGCKEAVQKIEAMIPELDKLTHKVFERIDFLKKNNS